MTLPTTVQAKTTGPVVRKGTVDDPVTVQEIVEVTRDANSAVSTQSNVDSGRHLVPKPVLKPGEKILGYAYGTTQSGYPKYKISKLTPTEQTDGGGSDRERRGVSNSGGRRGVSGQSSSTKVPAEDKVHQTIDSFASDLVASGRVSVQSSCTDSQLLRDTSIDGFPCPWITGENESWEDREGDGYVKKGNDDEGRIIVQDQLFDGDDAIGAASYVVMNPSTSYPGGDSHVVQKSYLRHAYDEKTDQEPDQRVVASPDGTSGEQINSAGVSVGKDSVGISLGWDNVKVDIDKNTNQRLAQWDTAFKADRSSTKTLGYTSIANYDYDKIGYNDDVMRCVVEGTFAKKVQDWFHDHDTFRSAVVYSR